MKLEGGHSSNMTSSNITSDYAISELGDFDLSQAASITGATLGVIVVAVGTFGNILVIVAVLCSKSLLKTSNMFIISLAVCDLFQTIMVRPLYIHTYIIGYWEFGAKVCQYALYASNLATLESILHVSAIAFYRYVIIVHPTVARKFQSPRAVLILLLLIYIVPLFIILLPSLPKIHTTPVMGQNMSFNNHIMFCVYNKFSDDRDKFSGSLIGIIKKSTFLLCAATFLFYCYMRIYHIVRVSGRMLDNTQGTVLSPARLRREMTLLKTVVVVFLAFVISYLPVTILYSTDKMVQVPDPVYVVAVILLWCSSSVNWMIYGLMNKQFLQAYRNVLCGCIVGYNTNVATEHGSRNSGSINGGSRNSGYRNGGSRNGVSRNGGSRFGGSRNGGSQHSFNMELQEYRQVIHTSRINRNQHGSVPES